MKRGATIFLMVLAGVAAAWVAAETIAGRLLALEFERATGGGYTLRVGRIDANPWRQSFTFNDINITGDKNLHINKLTIIKSSFNEGFRAKRIVIGERSAIDGIAWSGGRLAASRIVLFTRDGSNRITIDSLLLDTAARTFSVARAAVEPTYPKEEFTEKSWSHGDWTHVFLKNLSCTGVRFSTAGVRLDSIGIGGGALTSHKNRKAPAHRRKKEMYHTQYQRITPFFSFNVISFEGIDIRYEELPPRGDAAGVVTFGDVGGSAVCGDSTIVWSASARVMGVAPLIVGGTIPLRGDDFELSGKLSPAMASILNPAVTPLTGAKIGSGNISRLDFTIRGTSEKAFAGIVFSYDSLHPGMFDRRDREMRMLSKIVDGMIPDTLNTTGGGEFTRDPERSAWHYLWHTLLSALKSAVTDEKT